MDCEPNWAMDVRQHGRIISGSVKLVNESSNLKTRLSRVDVATNSFRELLRYERRGIQTLETPPSEAIGKLASIKKNIIEEHLRNELVRARAKSETASTAASKLSPFAKVIYKIGEMYGELDDVSELERIEIEAREEMDRTRLQVQLSKAEKAEFKGQKKKALDAYLDALFVIRKDSIDDSRQQKEINAIEEKIRSLGGKIPAVRSDGPWDQTSV